MKMTSKTRFFQYYVVRVRKPASFWEGKNNVITVFVELRY